MGRALPAVIYLARKAEGIAALRAFVDSYLRHPAGVDHDLVVVYKGFDDNRDKSEAQAVFKECEHVAIEVNDEGFDLGSYSKACETIDNEYVCCLNTFSRILADDWLKKLFLQISISNVGIVGATGSFESNRDTRIFIRKAQWFNHQLENETLPALEVLRSRLRRFLAFHFGDDRAFIPSSAEPASGTLAIDAAAEDRLRQLRTDYLDWWLPQQTQKDGLEAQYLQFPSFPNPHIRTNAFMLNRERFLRLCKTSFSVKMDACLFEAGEGGMTREILREAKKARIVGRDGVGYDVPLWPRSNTFRMGEQQNLLVADNQTDIYNRLNQESRILFNLVTWGERSVPMRPDFLGLGVRFHSASHFM